MKKSYTWKTARGAEIAATFTVEHITSRTVDSDGIKIEAKCSEWHRSVESITVNGKATEQKTLWFYGKQPVVIIGTSGKNNIMVAIPDEIANELYGEENAEFNAKFDKAEAFEKEYSAHVAKVTAAL